MKKATKKKAAALVGAAALGFLLHFLYEWAPNPVFALFSPVRESLWEHMKIVFWPLCAAGIFLAGQEGQARCAWRLSAAAASLLMLGAAYAYHVMLEGRGMVFDICLFLAAILLGFVLPGCFAAPAQRPGVRWAALAVWAAMAAALAAFTFWPPAGIIFADLSGGVNTFLTIPV